MIKTDTANTLIWKLGRLDSGKEEAGGKRAQFPRSSFVEWLVGIEGPDGKLFWDALYNIREEFVESLRKVVIEELRKELASIDAKISEDQETLHRLTENAENVIGESLYED